MQTNRSHNQDLSPLPLLATRIIATQLEHVGPDKGEKGLYPKGAVRSSQHVPAETGRIHVELDSEGVRSIQVGHKFE